MTTCNTRRCPVAWAAAGCSPVSYRGGSCAHHTMGASESSACWRNVLFYGIGEWERVGGDDVLVTSDSVVLW